MMSAETRRDIAEAVRHQQFPRRGIMQVVGRAVRGEQIVIEHLGAAPPVVEERDEFVVSRIIREEFEADLLVPEERGVGEVRGPYDRTSPEEQVQLWMELGGGRGVDEDLRVLAERGEGAR